MLRITTLKFSQGHARRILRFHSTATRGLIKEGWEAVIGIEVHAQINTKSKLFSGNVITSRYYSLIVVMIVYRFFHLV